jgi:hypothetical protein
MKQALALTILITFIVPSALAQTFRADDPVWVDNDAAIDVKHVAKHKLNDQYDFMIHAFGKPGDRVPKRAMNINTLGEVPDSSWFQNRHALRRMSVEELVRGPNSGNGPSMESPWTVIGAKTEGITPGFRIRDGRGDVYFIKFDPPQNPEMATAAEVISTKFFYALGYNVPENYLAFFTREQLVADRKAVMTDGHRPGASPGRSGSRCHSQAGSPLSGWEVSCGRQQTGLRHTPGPVSVLWNPARRPERHLPARAPSRTSGPSSLCRMAESR